MGREGLSRTETRTMLINAGHKFTGCNVNLRLSLFSQPARIRDGWLKTLVTQRPELTCEAADVYKQISFNFFKIKLPTNDSLTSICVSI